MTALLAVVLCATAEVHVNPTPASAVVQMDGEVFRGGQVEEGIHTIAVWRRGYWDYIETIDIQAGSKIRIAPRLQRGISFEGQVAERPFSEDVWKQVNGVWHADVIENQYGQWTVHGRIHGKLPEYYVLRISVRGSVKDAGSWVVGVRETDWDGQWRQYTLIGGEKRLWEMSGRVKEVRPLGDIRAVHVRSERFKDGYVEVRHLQIRAMTKDEFDKLGLVKPKGRS